MTSLLPKEKVLIEVRRHWLIIVIHALVLLVLAFVPIFVAPLALSYIVPDTVRQLGNELLAAMFIFASALWLLFVWVMFFAAWTNYYLDVLIVTNQRIIDREQFVLFSHDEVTIPLENIEDIKIEKTGLLATLFSFGNIQIQTAGAKRETIAKYARHPERAKELIEQGLIENSKKKPREKHKAEK